jgi:hypothetical protein
MGTVRELRGRGTFAVGSCYRKTHEDAAGWEDLSVCCTELQSVWIISSTTVNLHEGESVNKSQMDIKHKTCDIHTWKKHLFLDISSTNIDTLVQLLYQCVKTCSLEVFWLLSQPLPHLVGHNLQLSKVLEREFLDTVVNRFTQQTLPTVNRKLFFRNILCSLVVRP